MDNINEKIAACASAAWRGVLADIAGECGVHKGCEKDREDECSLFWPIYDALVEHFGESAPEQKEGHVARIYADGRWIRAECLLCEWSGVKWKARKGSGLPNAKAILQHSLRDHLLFRHVEKLPVLAPSVDTNAERTHEHEGACYDPQENGSYRKICEFADKEPTGRFPADASPQEPTCASIRMVQVPPAPYAKPMGTCDKPADDPIHKCDGGPYSHMFVESSVLPSKSERE